MPDGYRLSKIYVGNQKVRPSAQPVNQSFSYTGSDQYRQVPYTQDYIITACGAGSFTSCGGLGRGTVCLKAGDWVTVVVGQGGCHSAGGCSYGFGGCSTHSGYRAGGGLSGVFMCCACVGANDSARALVIGGGAGSGRSGVAGGNGGGECGGDGVNSGYGTYGSGGTQTGHGSSGNCASQQFYGGNGSGTYGYGGGGGRRGGNGNAGDGSADDDKGAGGGSGYVISTATNTVLTQGGGAGVNANGCVTIVSVNQG